LVGRVRAVSGHERLAVTAWEVCAVAPGAIAGPEGIDELPAGGWTAAAGPTTAAATLRAAGTWSLDGAARRFDEQDWWWRARVPLAPAAEREALVLCLGGLATLADVWWNGAHVLASDDMFVAHELAVAAAPSGDNELVIRCRALDGALAAKRPRPRWRVPMLEHQQLRWIRTTLLGRTPGWSPPAAAVGPWREVRVERRRGVIVEGLRLRAEVMGDAGVLGVICRARHAAGAMSIVLARDGREHRVELTGTVGGTHEQVGRLVVPDVARWWPHTHGEPACYDAHLEIGGATVELGPIGFRTIAIDHGARGDDFAVTVNGARVFCRGACWTPIDPVALDAPAAAVDAAVAQAADCGMNMLRVGGTMVYESDAFHDACDARGVMVWQDLMFANLDYPEDDAAFVATAEREVRQQLARLAARPSTTIVCGGSEVEQQAAMWGAPRERWAPRLFHDVLAKVAASEAPGVPYWPSSAHGGAFPHAPNAGTSSYYGVGAYLRPLDDARRSEVRFASECLAFANVPQQVAPGARVHHPAWKARVPRDLGAGWDFDDVRDHYVARLYGVDCAAVRHADPDRHLALGRVATGEVMAAAFGEWRRARSATRGALIWFLRDLWSGAGWGVVDAAGAPKPCWYYVKRALAPVAVAITDEGTSGLAIHVVNDRPEVLRGELELAMFRAGEIAVGRATRAIEVPARGAIELGAAELLDHFMDLSYAYRFGPPTCDVVVARIGGAEAFHFPTGLARSRELDVGLSVLARPGALVVTTRRFAQSVQIELEGAGPDARLGDNYFHLAPGAEKIISVERAAPARRAVVSALNAEATARVEVVP
jgi:beta-mannosidase